MTISNLHKRKVVCTDAEGNTYRFSIKHVIPMKHSNTYSAPVFDIELILDKSNNKYFSIYQFLINKSWVKKIEILPEKDLRIKTMSIMPKYVDDIVTIKDYSSINRLMEIFYANERVKMEITK